ncbi:MAG: hypothetical protein V2A76_00390 [Planctomycetota bacterium]
MRSVRLALGFGLILSNLALADDSAVLCVNGPSSIGVVHLLGDLPPTDTELTILRDGNTDADLHWTSSISGTISSHVSLTPSSGTIHPGQGMEDVDPIHVGTYSLNVHTTGGAQRAQLSVNVSAMASGFYSGTLTIQNAEVPANFVNIPLTLNVTSINFTPGDTLVGEIDPEADADAAGFYGLKGMSLRLTIRKSTEVEKLRITVLDPSAVPVRSFVVRTDRNHNKKVVLDEHGFFLLRVESEDGTTGAYEIKTGRILPGNALPHTFFKKQNKVDPTVVHVKFAGLPGAFVNVNFIPKLPLEVDEIQLTAFTVPSGETFNTSGFSADSLTAFHLVRVPLAQTGIYDLALRISGIKGDIVRVPVWQFQPKGHSTINLDE